MEKIGEKRPAPDNDGQRGVLSDVKALLIEGDGTVSHISFAKEKLCGYVKANSEEFFKSNFADKDVQDLIEGLRKQAAADAEAGTDGIIAIPAADAEQEDIVKAIADSISSQLSKGKITRPLGKIISHMCQDGYKNKAIIGELFDDVVPALKELAEQGTRVYVFTSGCSDLQRLLFACSKDGDKSEYISGYFDASAGPRTEKDTYAKIARDLELVPSDVMYLTHQSTEATAAHVAGMKTALIIRPGNPGLSEKDKETFLTISSFSQLFVEGSAEVPQKKVCPEQQPSPKKACPTAQAAQVQ